VESFFHDNHSYHSAGPDRTGRTGFQKSHPIMIALFGLLLRQYIGRPYSRWLEMTRHTSRGLVVPPRLPTASAAVSSMGKIRKILRYTISTVSTKFLQTRAVSRSSFLAESGRLHGKKWTQGFECGAARGVATPSLSSESIFPSNSKVLLSVQLMIWSAEWL
jgi:hypothetical protein